MRRSDGVRLALLLTVVRPALPDGGGVAGAQAISQGFELERQGRAEQAAALYKTVLRGDPTNIPALLGLERVLPSLGRLGELLPLVQQALVSDTGGAVRGLAVRTFTALEENDSVAALVRRWSAAHPGDASPWREWAIALEDRQRFEDARNVLQEGRQALGMGSALAVELGELEQRVGDWRAAALAWALAATEPRQLPNAVSQLEDAPADQRDLVVRTLTVSGASIPARRIAAELLVGWGQPGRGWETLAATLDPATPETALALRRFAERASGSAANVRRVRGPRPRARCSTRAIGWPRARSSRSSPAIRRPPRTSRRWRRPRWWRPPWRTASSTARPARWRVSSRMTARAARTVSGCGTSWWRPGSEWGASTGPSRHWDRTRASRPSPCAAGSTSTREISRLPSRHFAAPGHTRATATPRRRAPRCSPCSSRSTRSGVRSWAPRCRSSRGATRRRRSRRCGASPGNWAEDGPTCCCWRDESRSGWAGRRKGRRSTCSRTWCGAAGPEPQRRRPGSSWRGCCCGRARQRTRWRISSTWC